jgi:hypothetical protein
MAVRRNNNPGSLTALAVSLALLALPASAQAQAQDRGHGPWSNKGNGEAAAQGSAGKSATKSGDRHSGNDAGRQGNGSDAHGFRGAPSAPASAPAPQVRVQPQPQHNWSRGGGSGQNGRWNGGSNGDSPRDNRFMHGHRPSPVETQQSPPPSAPRVVEGYNGQGNGAADQWQNRNRGYVDSSRNPTSRDPGRDRARRGSDKNGWGRSNNSNSWQNGRWNDRQSYTGGGYRNWNRDWRGDSRYDWRSYRDSHHTIYRPGPYYAPYRDYRYQRLGVGFYLDALFFDSNYWIDEPWSYRLPPVYGPYRWIRYYDDALLVDTYTGEVVDVIYDFFW